MGIVPGSFGDSIFFRFLFSILMIFSRASVATDTLTQSQGISVGQTLITPNQMFELGFFSRGNSSYIGIWYKNVMENKIVWVANRENPLNATDTASTLAIGKDGNLELLDGLNDVIWSTNISSRPNKTIAVLADKGDFTLYDNTSQSSLWESFNYPSDCFISGMSIGTSKIAGESLFLSSWKTEDDPSQGIYIGGLTMETPPQVFVWKSSKPYWRSGPWDGWRFIGVPHMSGGYTNGLMLTPDNQRGSVYISYNSPTSTLVTVAILTPDGLLKMVHWNIESLTQDGPEWKSILLPCDVYGFCGSFGVCDRNGSRTCQCLKGFVPRSVDEWAKGNFSSGCVRRTELFCEKNSTLSSSDGKNDGFLHLSFMKLPDHHIYIFGVDSSGCRDSCLGNCSCNAYAYSAGINCLVWAGELVDIQKFSSTGTDLFLRLAYSELGEKKKNMKLIISLTTIFGVILLGVCLFGLYKLRSTIKVRRRCQFKDDSAGLKASSPLGSQLLSGNTTMTQTETSDLPIFDFSTLSDATNDFSEENKLGGGGFGPVYKGKLEDGLEIAVKRLSNHSGQGADEFRNEILLISKLQHRNLVKLLGYCIKGDEKLLIYEYLKNKSLDGFLFDTQSGILLDWDKRLNIIQGIARGILYLHRDSRLRIIHRDLKAGNILLDDNMDPKISDFGLARAFEITQELANTRRVVGTFGYMSPEYAVGGIFSEKSDVFSFGILLLEIISGIRNTNFYHEKHNLLSYAWKLWKEEKGLEMMDPNISGSCRDEEFLQCLHIGILCVQDHAIDRPTMASVVLMLTSEIDLPKPTPPTFYQNLICSDYLRPQSNSDSVNDVTMSQVGGR